MPAPPPSQAHPSPAILLHPRPRSQHPAQPNPLPPLLQTPSGLALVELQGSINLPPFPPDTPPTATGTTSSSGGVGTSRTPAIPIGRLHFPDYHPANISGSGSNTGSGGGDGAGGKSGDDDTAWMKRVWMYVGEHQRLQGEVRKLGRAVAVLRRRRRGRRRSWRGETGTEEGGGGGVLFGGGGGGGGGGGEGDEESEGEGELEVMEIVKYKIVFSSRPEPVGGGVG